MILSGDRGESLEETRNGVGEVVRRAGQADFNVGDVADEAVANDFGCFVELRNGTLPRSGLPDDVVLVHGANDGLLFGDSAGERLFAVDVFLARGGFGGDDGVPVIGDGDHDGVDVVTRDDLAVVVDGGAVLVAIVGVDGVDGGLQVIFLDIAGGNNLAIIEAEKCLGVGGSHHAPADDADGDALVCRHAAGARERAAERAAAAAADWRKCGA